jgi:hypothetical protein
MCAGRGRASPTVTAAWPWVALAGLGAFHGLNPAMGWLFAVALGLQRKTRAAVLWSLLPIAAGHALSVALVIAAVGVLRAFVNFVTLQVGAAVTLIAFGLYRLLARHRVRVGMQVGAIDLMLWSFLMATAHGAGLMLLPVLLGMPIGILRHDHVHMAVATAVGRSAVTGLAAVAVHTAVMLAVAGAIAIVVYEWVGLAFLRRGWINLDLVWVLALIGAGGILLVFGVS